MTAGKGFSRRKFNTALGAAGLATALAPFGIVGAQVPTRLKVGVLLPRSGVQALIGQSCQKGADLAPEVIRQVLGVDVEVMSADTESNTDTARLRAERLIQEGANVLVGAFDSGHTAAIAQVAEQRGVPLVINIAAAPQITEQGYKFVFRNFPTAIDLTRNGLALMGDIFRETKTVPRTAVFMHVNDTFGQAMSKGIGATLPRLDFLPFKVVDTIPYDPAAKDLTVEVSKAKGSNADFLMLVCRLNDAIVLRRRWSSSAGARWGSSAPARPASTRSSTTRRSASTPSTRSATPSGSIRSRR
jgi:branched-chain amino acid transport system substrate-binding protein